MQKRRLGLVSTHSRPKAAAIAKSIGHHALKVSTHSRPKAAAVDDLPALIQHFVSTHSRPKAAARQTQLPGGAVEFQHTAARRRLPAGQRVPKKVSVVSTHSRPKAAALIRLFFAFFASSFNTQPPEGGCWPCRWRLPAGRCFNTQPPEGGCRRADAIARRGGSFNTQPPEGGCATPPLAAPRSVVSTHSRPKAAAPCLKTL